VTAAHRWDARRTLRCVDCGAALPFGPAQLDGEHAAAVALEIRAAEIVADAEDVDAVFVAREPAEKFGWICCTDGMMPLPNELAGWLAREIYDARRAP
jgi:hypothetical protein